MPLPWKKTRISQLVSDHLHSPKRGGSLVVETGFPTSLVDLFVKNRDRLKKPSKKKRSTLHDPVILPPAPPPLPPSNPLRSHISFTSSDLVSKLENEIVVGDVVPSVNRVIMQEDVEVPDANWVYVAVLKIFFVVVLALSTKRFVVGITVSAFVLFFLEYMGKYVYRLLDPFSDTQMMLKSIIQRVVRFNRIKQDKVEGEIGSVKARIEREESVVSDCCDLIEDQDSNGTNSEIEIVQPNSNLVSQPIVIAVGCYKKWGLEEMDSNKEVMEKEEDYKCEVSELKHRHSRRAKMKLKMKKLVPEKLRSSKKKCSVLRSEADGSIEGDKGTEQEKDKDVEQCEFECHEKLPTLSSGCCDLEEDMVDAVCNSGELPPGDSEAAVVVEVVRKETEGNSGYWVLCLIALAGLVGGRILALVLTMCWCLILKSSGRLRSYIKVPMVRSSVEISN